MAVAIIVIFGGLYPYSSFFVCDRVDLLIWHCALEGSRIVISRITCRCTQRSVCKLDMTAYAFQTKVNGGKLKGLEDILSKVEGM